MKTINDKQYKECDVVMLTTDSGTIGLFPNSNELVNYHEFLASEPIRQHLYILSDDEIDKGDWYIWLNNKQICQAEGMIMVINNHVKNGDIKKIIATTDTLKLNSVKISVSSDFTLEQISENMPCLPQPLQEFVEHYIEQHNQGNIIDKVLVEYEGSFGYSDSDSWESPVINLYNSINTLSGKTSWSRDEVVKLLEDIFYFGAESQREGKAHIEICDEWISKNL
jgi:hypothetical protein